MPDHWTVLASAAARVSYESTVSGSASPAGRSVPAGAAGADPSKPALEEGLQWLADFEAAVAAGMGIRVALPDTHGLDRLVVLGVRGADDPAGRRPAFDRSV